MTNAIPIFDPRIAAKSVDPWTSHKAAEQAGGLALRHYRRIVDWLDGIYPRAATYEQIADGAGIEKHAAARRLPEIEAASLIERAGTAKLKSGRAGTLWRIVQRREA